MLTQTINAYPYRQYADDDDIRTFFEMYNSASQQYLNWFNEVGLPYYPGLSAPLLQWVGEGLYGVPFYNALESPGTPAVGPLNTAALNTIPLNSYAPPSETYYQVTDDIYKRIITWNFYKGDGNRFCPRWLKRRIMRFLVGVNGIDPQPWNEGFVMGCENTTAISVEFSGETCTIAINQLAISAMLQLTPNILSIFSAAFLSPGVLEKPIEWNYVVDIETSIHAIVSPLSLSVIGASASEATGNATVEVLGGSGTYTYAWTWLSGGSGITISAPSANATEFTTSGLTPGQTVSGVAQCLITDTVLSETTTCAVNVSLSRVTLPTAIPAPASIATAGSTSNITSPQVMVTAAGGSGPYTFLWSWQSGGAGIGIDSPNTSATTFTGIGMATGDTFTGTAQCLVTDAYSQTVTCTVPIEIARATAVSASISSGALSTTGASAAETTATTTANASGGVSPYTYSWSWQSGGAGIAIDAPAGAATAFTSSSLSPSSTASGTAVCTVTDSVGQQAQVTCAVSITRVSVVSASASPTSQISTGGSTTQTTGTSTISASGGSGAYGYSWIWGSGGAGISINSPFAVGTSFTATGLAKPQTVSGIAVCHVTDGYGQTTVVSVPVEIECLSDEFSASMTAGASGGGEIGYVQGTAGTITNHSLPGGLTIGLICDIYSVSGGVPSFRYSVLGVSGFSSDPGQGWLEQITANTTLTGTSASYSYSGGIAYWTWVTAFGFANGETYPVTINFVL